MPEKTRKTALVVFTLTAILLLGCSGGGESASDASMDGWADGGDAAADGAGSDGDSDSDNDADSDSDMDADSDAGDGAPGHAMGPGTDNEYSPDASNSNGVDVNDAGWLELDTTKLMLKYLWVSNSAEGTVSKIDTEALAEVGRYAVGLNESRADPSRTSVDLIGDVFIGNRNTNYGDPGMSSLTKIAAEKERCVDRNGNGAIDTSAGPNDVYPRSDGGVVPEGQSTDECVLWTRGFDDTDPTHLDTSYGCNGMRAVAATAETGDNYEVNGHVWVGCYGAYDGTNITGGPAVYKLHGNTGDLLEEYKLSGCHPYGFFLDKDKRLWTACRDGWGWAIDEGVAWIDTGNGAEHFMPDEPGLTDGPNPYGFALDGEGRVWITKYEGWVYRYTPGTEPDLTGGTWEGLSVTDAFRGMAVDKDGFVWAVDTTDDAVIYLIDPDLFPDPSSILGNYYLGDDDTGGSVHARDGVGVAVDFSGHVWGISRNAGDPTGYATRLEIDRSGSTPVVISKTVIPVGREPYVYSDMIGYNLRNFTTKEGWYRQRFEVCSGRSTKWKKISWEAKIPANTSIVIRARTADKSDDLLQAQWFVVATDPPDTSPKDLPADLPEGHFIALEIRLYTTTDGVTPSVGKISFTYECTSPLQ